MKAIVQDRYGTPEVLELREIDMPEIGDSEVLIRVHAASVNPADWHFMTGRPYLVRFASGLRKPKTPVRGSDVAGTVEAVGENVTGFRPGDEVWGGCRGAYAEYADAAERTLVPKPANITFEQAAAVPIAGVTALQALRDIGKVQPGQRVLVNGASGGVGTFATQIARVFGAHVTGVCSTRNVEMVRSLGADRVIDYTERDFTQGDEGYDLIVDCVGGHSLGAYRRVLSPGGTRVVVGSEEMGNWVAPFALMLQPMLGSLGRSKKTRGFLARITKEDLSFLAGLLQEGKVRSVIDRRYDLEDTAEALRHQGEGHARGKKVIVVAD